MRNLERLPTSSDEEKNTTNFLIKSYQRRYEDIRSNVRNATKPPKVILRVKTNYIGYNWQQSKHQLEKAKEIEVNTLCSC